MDAGSRRSCAVTAFRVGPCILQSNHLDAP